MTRPMSIETAEQIKQTYRRMVKRAKFAPAAPSDGMGHIVGEQDTEAEAEAYVEPWWEEEQSDYYFCGVPDWRGRPALIFAIEAARNICGVSYEPAIKLLRMAADELEGLSK